MGGSEDSSELGIVKFMDLASDLLKMIDESTDLEDQWYSIACDLVSCIQNNEQTYAPPPPDNFMNYPRQQLNL